MFQKNSTTRQWVAVLAETEAVQKFLAPKLEDQSSYTFECKFVKAFLLIYFSVFQNVPAFTDKPGHFNK